MMEEPRSCDVCAGVVDIITIGKALPDGRVVPAKIGACQRCGKWFNEAGLRDLLPARDVEPLQS